MAFIKRDIDAARIYQEEKARAEARRQIEAKQKAQGCLGLLVIIFGFWLYAQIPHGTKAPAKPAPTQGELAQQKIDQEKRAAEARVAHEKHECEEDGAMAYFTSQDFVKRQLKAPATASFPWFYNIHTHYLGQCRHEVNAYVDSQNLFGANVRTRYIATLRYAGNDKWTLEDLKFFQ